MGSILGNLCWRMSKSKGSKPQFRQNGKRPPSLDIAALTCCSVSGGLPCSIRTQLLGESASISLMFGPRTDYRLKNVVAPGLDTNGRAIFDIGAPASGNMAPHFLRLGVEAVP
jgi:hypothetical protein